MWSSGLVGDVKVRRRPGVPDGLAHLGVARAHRGRLALSPRLGPVGDLGARLARRLVHDVGIDDGLDVGVVGRLGRPEAQI